MNGNYTDPFHEDELKRILKEIYPTKFPEIIVNATKIGSSIQEYIYNAINVYGVLLEENTKGKLIHILTKNPKPIVRENGNLCIYLNEEKGDKVVILKVPGLEYRVNGKASGNIEQNGK